jgi:hypothetical protein
MIRRRRILWREAAAEGAKATTTDTRAGHEPYAVGDEARLRDVAWLRDESMISPL